MKKGLYGGGFFQAEGRRRGSLLCLILFAHLLGAPLAVDAASARRHLQNLKTAVQAQQRAIEKSFSLQGTGRETFEFAVTSAGRIAIRAEWTGPTGKLALILNGPGQVGYYAREEGPSPLSLEFNVTSGLLAKGTAWRITIASFQASGSAQGKLRITAPMPGEALERQTATSAAKPTFKPVERPVPAAAQKAPAAIRPRPSREQESFSPDELQDVAKLRAALEESIPKAVQDSPLSGVLVPLAFQALEEIAGISRLLREYYRSSQRKKGQAESDFALLFRKAARAYQDLSPEFKARHLDPVLAALGKGQKIDRRHLADAVIRTVDPSFERKVQQTFRASFGPSRFQMPGDAARTDRATVQALSSWKPASRPVKLSAVPTAQRQKIEAVIKSAGAELTPAAQNELQAAFREAGRPAPSLTTAHPVFQAAADHTGLSRDLSYLNNVVTSVDYHRHMITLDSFICLNKNETTDDEPYFALTTILPQFDPADPVFFSFLKDGCLNRVAGFTTRTYGDVGKNTERGLKGDDRVVFDYLTFNAPFTIAIDLWEEDFSKGTVSDAVHKAARDLAAHIIGEISAAVRAKIATLIHEAMSSAFTGLTGQQMGTVFGLIDDILGSDISFADFEKVLYGVFSGRAVDPSWYVLYFLFSGGDWLQTLAMIGGGSTLVGWVMLGLAVLGPTLSDLFDNLGSGNIGGVLLDILKIVTVIPLIIDFFESVAGGITEFFNWLFSILDPDDHIGSKTIVVERVSADWHNDARDGEWTHDKLAGGVRVDEADSWFRRRGWGPNGGNSSLVWNGIFWIPYANYRRITKLPNPPFAPREVVTTEYNAYYQVKREVAGGRTTFGFHLPRRPGASKIIRYQGKSSPNAWWDNVLRVTAMSLNTVENPFVCVIEDATGRAWTNVNEGVSFELPASPSASYTIYIIKLSEGEMGGFLSLYEGSEIEVQCSGTRLGGGGGSRGSGTSSGDGPPRRMK